ncbi:MAG: molecular chaperone DnaK [Azoarcus sp.]|nr:molecular chaperone DnaK [Azoarcus sp.]
MTIDLETFRARITGDLQNLEESLREAESAGRTVMLDQASVGRLSRMDAMQQQAMAQELRARLITSRRRLQAALARIDAGSFGHCCQCDAEIDPKRLTHDPAAVFCPDCVAERENG